MVRVYHYTSKAGAEAIERTKLILGSAKTASGGGDAHFGNGVYVTDLPPDKVTKDDLVLNNYDDNDPAALKINRELHGHKVEWVVVIELPDLCV